MDGQKKGISPIALVLIAIIVIFVLIPVLWWALKMTFQLVMGIISLAVLLAIIYAIYSLIRWGMKNSS